MWDQIKEESQWKGCKLRKSPKSGAERKGVKNRKDMDIHSPRRESKILVIGIPESGNKQWREEVTEERAQENIPKLKGLIIQI